MAENLMKMYETMNASAQKELYDFALFLLSKNDKKESSVQKKSMYGVWKNDSFYMAADFDEPLEDFAEYM
ncbi:DUF2281 domain-containing protein [Treponema sp.]|uniref:type II toxin-antitoxin system VapB family antitoxin n=1 Tax=Treponema sp. TaxID=166 RepID=UPI00388F01BC